MQGKGNSKTKERMHSAVLPSPHEILGKSYISLSKIGADHSANCDKSYQYAVNDPTYKNSSYRHLLISVIFQYL